MVSGVVLALEKRLVAATIPVRKAVASSFSILALLLMLYNSLAIISDTELADLSLHSISPKRPGLPVVILIMTASCIMRPCSRKAESRSIPLATSRAKTKSTL